MVDALRAGNYAVKVLYEFFRAYAKNVFKDVGRSEEAFCDFLPGDGLLEVFFVLFFCLFAGLEPVFNQIRVC